MIFWDVGITNFLDWSLWGYFCGCIVGNVVIIEDVVFVRVLGVYVY